MLATSRADEKRCFPRWMAASLLNSVPSEQRIVLTWNRLNGEAFELVWCSLQVPKRGSIEALDWRGRVF